MAINFYFSLGTSFAINWLSASYIVEASFYIRPLDLLLFDLDNMNGFYSVFYFFIIEFIDSVDTILAFLQLIALELKVFRVD
jgi:hypothetical protein